MQGVKSASFIADAAVAIQGDPSKMTDPTQKAMLSQGLSMHAEGKSASAPVAADMKVSLGIAGQTIDMGVMAKGDKSWVQYQNVWYALDKKSAKSLSGQADVGAAPTQQLKSFGLDPAAWGTTYKLVGTEDLSGAKVYHVTASADPQKLADALMKAASDPSLAKKLGDQSQLKQLEQGLTQSKAQAEQLKKSLKTVSVDYWIGVDDMLMHKAAFAAVLDMKGQQGMNGVDGMSLKLSATMSGFDQPVTVTPPAKAQPVSKLMNQMLGGMMGGSGGTSGITL